VHKTPLASRLFAKRFVELFDRQSVTSNRSVESEVVMVLHDQAPQIELLRDYPESVVEELHQALQRGAAARPDPQRSDFFELEGASEVFYVHVSPVNGRVLLIGLWSKSDLPELVSQNSHVA
jgi:hypothetical protein